MTPERYKKIRAVADAALDRPDAERSAFLAAACAGDAALRDEVASLLAAYDAVRAGDFLEPPVVRSTGGGTGALEGDGLEGALPPGHRVGAYEIVDVVGHGGMAVVHRAVRADDEYRQRVALKVIRRGMDTAQGQRRFREERQILAALAHPGIARLLDGGTTEEGLPYFVMEYVEGEHIDAYCDGRRLDIAARLRLFLGVCDAVHYAHQALVVHRDLKPGNVLVTGAGEPKLLDFGIARLVQPAGAATSDPTITQARMLTLDYASPEQVRGEPVTTATDVYSLGVLLYELLSGRGPYRITQRHEVLAAICDQDPERPSASVSRTTKRSAAQDTSAITADAVSGARGLTPALLRKKLAGDLDTIVLKALRKSPSDRYASVEAFAEDVRRHLDGRPVHARPHTLGYRTGKFVRRNPAAVVATGLAVAALLGGIVATTRQARVANEQRLRAERRLRDAHELASALLFKVHDVIRHLPGSTVAREEVVEIALAHLERLRVEAAGDRNLQRDVASAYERLAEVQGTLTADATRGDVARARRSLDRALALRESILREAPGSPDDRRSLAELHGKVSQWARGNQDYEEASVHAERQRAIVESLARDLPVDVHHAALAAAHGNLASALYGRGDSARGGPARDRSIELRRSVLRLRPSDPLARINLADDLRMRGTTASQSNRPEGEADLREAIALLEPLVSADPNLTTAVLALARSQWFLGSSLANRGEREEAVRELRRALVTAEAAARSDPANLKHRLDLSGNRMDLAKVLAGLGRARDAVLEARASVAGLEPVVGESSNAALEAYLAYKRGRLARILLDGSPSAGSERPAWLREARQQAHRGAETMTRLRREDEKLFTPRGESPAEVLRDVDAALEHRTRGPTHSRAR